MEVLDSPQGQKQNLQTSFRKSSSMKSQKDLWLIVREGSLADVDSALALLKRNGGNVNARNTFGLTPLHIAIWRNHIPIVRRLLAAGADPDARVFMWSKVKCEAKLIWVDAVKESFGRFGMKEIKGFFEGQPSE